MRTRLVILLALTLPVVVVADPSPPSPLVSKILACFEAEGGKPTDADVALLQQHGDALTKALCGQPGAPADCLAQISAASCADLGGKLVPSAAQAVPSGPAAPWATDFAFALTDKVLACYAAEAGEPAPDADTQALHEFAGTLASALTALTAAGCKVDEGRQTACIGAIQSLSCKSLAAQLTPAGADPTALIEALAATCAGFVTCSEATAP